MILQRRADLAGDGGQQLAVPGREGAPSLAPEQVDDADRARLPRLRRVLDGHREGRFGAQVGGERGMAAVSARADDRLAVTEHARGEHVPGGVERPVQSGDSFGGDLVQQPVAGVVDPQRAAAGAQDVADFVEDDARGFAQLQDRAQDLADRIQQVDFLVARGQLAAEEVDFLFGIQDPDELASRRGRRPRPRMGPRDVAPARDGDPRACAAGASGPRPASLPPTFPASGSASSGYTTRSATRSRTWNRQGRLRANSSSIARAGRGSGRAPDSLIRVVPDRVSAAG